MSTIFHIAMKDLLLLWRDKAGLFWVLGFPLLMALFFGSIFSSSGGTGSQSAMKVAVIDNDQSDQSHEFVTQLGEIDALSVSSMSADSAKQMVRIGKLIAFLQINNGFGESFGFGGEEGSELLELGIDPSRTAEGGFLKGMLSQAFFQSMQSSFSNLSQSVNLQERLSAIKKDTTLTPADRDRIRAVLTNLSGLFGALQQDTSGIDSGADSASTENAMSGPKFKMVDISLQRSGPRSSWEITFPSSILWALIGVCASFAISIVIERTKGTFLRLRLAPITRTQILAGKGLACFLASVLAAVLLLAFAAVVFHMRITNPLGLIAAVIAASFCFVGLMMLISVMGRTEQAVAGAGWGVLLVMAMLGGGMVPLFVMPSWMQTMSNVSPVKWGIVALEGAIWREFTFGQMMTPILILVAVGIVSFAIGARVISRQEG
ncbi:MAG: ABC transporter permease [candidate division Zixibacteria bacterium]|nr:ABC transporter permease [candidate division Zixibacteria bacterium]